MTRSTAPPATAAWIDGYNCGYSAADQSPVRSIPPAPQAHSDQADGWAGGWLHGWADGRTDLRRPVLPGFQTADIPPTR